MDQNTLLEIVQKLAPEATTNTGNQFPEATIAPELFHKVAEQLKTNNETKLDFLFCQTGVDVKGQLGVVYHLRSTQLNHSLVIKTFTSDRENPEIETVSDIWPAAGFFEREIFDLFGIKFTNHPDMRRLFLEDDFVGFPLRKDFVDPINIIEK